MDTQEFKSRYSQNERNFFQADLKGANLSGIELANVVFDSADLTEVDFRTAKLINVNFRLAVLVKADLRGADLSSCTLVNTKMDEALYDDKTKFPDQFEPGGAGLVLVGEQEPLEESYVQPLEIADLEESDVDLWGDLGTLGKLLEEKNEEQLKENNAALLGINNEKQLKESAEAKSTKKESKAATIVLRSYLLMIALSLSLFLAYKQNNQIGEQNNQISLLKIANQYQREINSSVKRNLNLTNEAMRKLSNLAMLSENINIEEIDQDQKKLQEKLTNLIDRIEKIKNDRDSKHEFYTSISKYPYRLDPGNQVSYKVVLNSNNTESNPAMYRFYVPEDSSFNIFLEAMLENSTDDGDFEILDSTSKSVPDSKSIKAGTDKLSIFLKKGFYDIKIWRVSGTIFVLTIQNKNNSSSLNYPPPPPPLLPP